MHGRRIALRHDSLAGSPLLRPSELSLQSDVRKQQAQTPTVVAWEATHGGVILVFCERDYPSLSIWGYCFLQLHTKDTLVPAII